MKKAMLAAIIAATALVPPALAQERGQRWGGNRPGAEAGQGSAPARPSGGGGWRQPGGDGGAPRNWGGDRGQWRQQERPAAPVTAPQSAPPQRQWNGGDRGQWRGERPTRPEGGQWNGGNRPGRPDGGQWNGNRPGRPDGGQWNGNRPGRPDGGQWNNRDRFDRGNPGWNGARGNYGRYDRDNRSWNDRNGGRWNNGWRNDRRYDWRGYRTLNRNVYRLPRYYAPSGWGYGYRRFSIGFTLSSVLFAQQYWINDPFYYRLPEVDGPYRWVRYYNDALLVDIYTGEVIDTIYDIFW